jgi:pyruvate kinase
MRTCKIVATLGPASADATTIAALIEAGVDVFRQNLAHGDLDFHDACAKIVRERSEAAGRPVGLLLDLPGPKMRTGVVRDDQLVLEAGMTLVLTGDDVIGNETRVSTTVGDLGSMVDEGDEIYLADGAIVLRVVSVDKGDVATEVMRRGLLRSRKGMHLPAAEQHIAGFTEADEAALAFAVSMQADFVGLSFVRDATDVERVNDLLSKRRSKPLVVPKIETRSAIENLDKIISASEAIMIARGDLGIQMPLERVPMLQKQIIRACNIAGVPVITATQMLESMTQSPLPTRAEVNDVANAVLDGTDALMLSEETAVGQNPVEAVHVMKRTIDVTGFAPSPSGELGDDSEDRVSWAVAHAAVQAASDLDVAAIVCPTRSGATPRRVASFRPPMPILALTSRTEILGGLALLWGVVPLAMDVRPEGADESAVVEAARVAGAVAEGDLVALVAGSAGRRAGRTDSLRIVRVEGR